MNSDARIAAGPPPLTTGRLQLRGLVPEDAADVFAYASDPAMADFVEWLPHATLADSLSSIKRMQLHSAAGNYQWGIIDPRDGRLIGTCGFIASAPAHRRAEVVYAVARSRWNQGIATEAVAAVIRLGFTDLNLNRIEARCLPSNVASRRVMSKLGMIFEGVLREHVLMKGRFVDLAMHSLLHREWKAGAQ